MKIVSAYDMNNKLFEGAPITNKKGETFILNEFGEALNIKDVKTYRIVEELEGDEIQAKVEDDLNQLNFEDNDKLLKAPEADIEKAAKDREKELKDDGLDIGEGEYRDRFITSVKAANALNGVTNGTVSDSEALKNFIEADETNIENLPINDINSVNTCTPEYDGNEYETEDNENVDDVSGIYKKIYEFIDNYTENTKKFNESELLLNLCNTYKIKVDNIKGNSLSESITNIIKEIK